MCFREGDQSEGTRAQSTDEQALTSGLEAEEVQVSSEPEMTGVGRTRPAEKAKENVTEGTYGSKGAEQNTRTIKD